MKKLTMLLVFVFIFAQFAMAADVQKSVRMQRGNVLIDVNINTAGLTSEKIDIDGKTYTKLNLEDSGITFEKGAPELRTVSAMLAAPQGMVNVSIADSEYVEYNNISVVPSKGALTRDINPEEVAFEFGPEYNQEGWYPSTEKMISNVESFILRDISGVRVEVIPFQVNAKENKLRVYNKLTVAVASSANRGVGARVNYTGSSDFEKIYSDVFMNYQSPFQTRDGRINAPDERKNLLIVAYDEFYNAVKPLADWKKKSGYDVELVKYSDVASSADSLKAYFQKKYDNGDLCFVTLVGDIEHIPTLKGKFEGANSDNMYTKLAGNDNIPDAFISRLSCKNVDDVKTVVNKTLDYETNPQVDGKWYKRALGIASNEGNPKDYERSDYLSQTLKKELGFTKVWECYAPDSNGGGWYWKDDNEFDSNPFNPGGFAPPAMYSTGLPRFDSFDSSNNSSDKSIVFDAVNSGVSIINYIGHGSDYTWVTSGFSATDAGKLKNTGKYPVIWDVACVNGAFHRNTCFAEGWLNAGTPSAPAGAIGISAGSTNESWVPPCEWQGEIIHNQLGKKLNSTATVVNMYGLLAVAEKYGASDRSEGNKLIEQKIYFGEGTVSLRTEAPKRIAAEAVLVDNTIMIAVDGASREALTVTAYDENVERTISAKTNSRGEIEIPYEGQTHITVTGSNIVPVIDLEIQK